ncbi:HEAT repeat domain-containing protein [bacterium]|nr:HEAT repeat domain-containing protein [bacterium]
MHYRGKSFKYWRNRLDDADWETQYSAWVAMSHFASEYQEAFDLMIKGLEESNVSLRILAVDTLGQLRDASSLNPLIKRIVDDDIDVRVSVCLALLKFDQPIIIPDSSAAFLLRNFWEEEALQFYLHRDEIIDLLFKSGHSELLYPVLMRGALKYDTSIAQTAIRHLARYAGQDAANARAVRSAVCERLVTLAITESRKIDYCCEALNQIDCEFAKMKFVEVVKIYLNNSQALPSDNVQNAVRALRSFRGPEILPLMNQLLVCDDYNLVEEAFWVVYDYGDAALSSVPFLVDAYHRFRKHQPGRSSDGHVPDFL